MPRGNKTGPMGMGPMTGRGAGLCGGNSVPGFMSPGGGRFGNSAGMGGGYGGRGRGFRNRFFATGLPGWLRFLLPDGYPETGSGFSREEEIRTLKAQAERLNGSLEAVNRRLSKIDNKEVSEEA